MPNDSSLPRPNIPQPGQDGQASSASQPSSTSQASQPVSGVSAPPSSSTTPTPPSLPQTTTSQTTVPQTTVSGLDTQHPGGAPPQLNEQGQVMSTSTISQTQQAPNYEQIQAPPESTLQKVQAAGPASPGAAGRRTELGGASGIPGGTNQANADQAQAQQTQTAPVTPQQTIQATAQAQQEQAADLRQTPSTHPSLGPVSYTHLTLPTKRIV